MRNLKRAFSLVLALVMVLGMITVVPVAAADETSTTVTSNFTDAAEINPDYMEAVAITGGIGLFAGADGKFMPKGTVTRAQMATIIVKMLYGGDVNADSFKGNGKFSDTASFEGGWAEGYINWCSTLGIVAGYGDGTFRPGNQVTTAEAATMILNALKIDAGEGTWPNTVMAKAEEEDLFEDLKPMPGTNVALSREELAVIALNGLNWSDSDATGWYVTGGTADSKMTFETYKDADKYCDKVNGTDILPLEGRDSLASTVYDLKQTTGFIVANQATGEKYTAVSVDGTSVPSKFDVATDASMVGHKVTVWYEEQYKSEREPGKTYAVSEAAEYITLAEDAESAKDYKAAFGTKYDLPASVVLVSGTGYVTTGSTIAGYVANSAAPAGTYAIDIETGALCGYIAPKAYTVAKVGYVDNTAESEKILVGALSLSNTAEDDEVVEYDGIAKDDYVVYYQMQGVYVLTKLEEVTGSVTKIDTNKKGQKVVTLDGSKEYTQSTATGTIANTLTASALTSGFDYKQTYTFYLDPAGNFVCFEKVEGGAFDMANTFYVLGVMQRNETDNYGKTSTWYFARGVDMTGNEAMVPIGIKTAAGDEYGAKTIAEANNFYSVEDLTGTEEKKYGLKELVSFPSAYNADDPTATYSFEVASYGRPTNEIDWWEGGKFEYGVAEQFAGNGTLESGIYCYNHKATKYIVVEGTADQTYPLETVVYTGTATIKFASQVKFRVLVTRQANGTNNIEAMAFPMNVDHGLNATMVYVDKYHTTPNGTDAFGNVYGVHDALTGEAKEITLSKDIDSIPVGFYSVGYDADEEIYKLAVDGEGTPVKVPAADTETKFEQRDRTDGRYFESVVYDFDMTAYNGSSIWTTLNSHSVSGTKVIDARTDEQIAKDGVARITSLDQVWAMKDSMPWVNIELDMCHTYSPSKIVTIFVEVYNNRDFGIDNLVYAYDFAATEVSVVTGEIHATGDVIELPTGVTAPKPGFYYLETGDNGSVSLRAASDLDTTAYVAVGSDSGVPAYNAIFNITDKEDLNTTEGFANYGVVEYQILSVKDKDLLMIMGYGEQEGAADKSTADAAVQRTEFDAVVDNTGSGITLDNLESKQNEMCIIYTAYAMNGNRKMMVITDVDAGTTINTAAGLDAVPAGADFTNLSDVAIADLDDLKTKANNGYSFTAKLYNLSGGYKLVVTHCMQADAVTGTLTASDFASGAVVLTGETSVGTGITVTGDWTIDLNGQTLNGTGAPYFTVGTGATLTIMDSANGGKIEGIETANAMIKIDGGEVILNGGTLTGHKNTDAAVYGSAVVLSKLGSKFTMNGGEISNNTSVGRGGAVGVQDSLNGTYITINGGTIVDNYADRASSIYTQSTVYFTMTGGTIGAGYELDGTENAENVWMRLTDVKISGSAKVENMQVYDGCTFQISNLTEGAQIEETRKQVVATMDATVSHNAGLYTYAPSSGIEILVVQPAKGGTISVTPATAEMGDTVTVNDAPATGYTLSYIKLNGETLTGNTFVVEGEVNRVTAAFELETYMITKGAETNGTFTLSAGSATMGEEITVETAPATGYEVLAVKVNGSEDGVTDNGDGTYTFTMPAEAVTVTVAFDQPSFNITKAATTNGSFAVSANKATAGTEVTVTTTPNSGYEVASVMAGSVAATKTGRNTYTFDMPANAVEVTVTFQTVTPATITASNFVAGQTLTLTKDSKLDAAISLTAAGTYTLDLDGYTLSGTAAPYITVGTGVTLIIKDTFGGGKIQGLASATDSMFKVTGGQLTLQSGTLTGNTGAANGGAVNVDGGKFVMSGGTISNNTTTAYGGAIFLAKNASSSTFEMSGGIITGNKSAKGGAISSAENASANCTIAISGGEITGNDASGRGATMHLFDTDVTISGGKFGWGYVNGSAASASHAETEFRAGCVVKISGGEFDEIGTQSQPWTLEISGTAKIAKVLFTGGTSGCTFKVSGLEAGASITLGADANAAVTLQTDSTVSIEGTAGKKNAVYTFNG